MCQLLRKLTIYKNLAIYSVQAGKSGEGVQAWRVEASDFAFSELSGKCRIGS